MSHSDWGFLLSWLRLRTVIREQLCKGGKELQVDTTTNCVTCCWTLAFTEANTESNWMSLLNANLSSYDINTILTLKNSIKKNYFKCLRFLI